eukprot:gene69-biopygen8853
MRRDPMLSPPYPFPPYPFPTYLARAAAPRLCRAVGLRRCPAAGLKTPRSVRRDTKKCLPRGRLVSPWSRDAPQPLGGHRRPHRRHFLLPTPPDGHWRPRRSHFVFSIPHWHHLERGYPFQSIHSLWSKPERHHIPYRVSFENHLP